MLADQLPDPLLIVKWWVNNPSELQQVHLVACEHGNCLLTRVSGTTTAFVNYQMGRNAKFQLEVVEIKM